MKRRFLAAALSAALVLSLAACGGGGKGGSSSSNSDASSQAGGSSQTGGSSSDVSQPGAGSSADNSASSVDGSASSADVSQPDGSGADTSEPSAPETKVTLTLNKTSVTLNKAGATFKLNYKTDPEIDADPTYTSSDKKIATVDKNGTIKAVAPGKATITVECGGATASASVTCSWKEETSKPETSKPADNKPADNKPAGGDTSKPADPPTPAKVDLSAFYKTVTGKYSFGSLDLADDTILDMFYEGMSRIGTEQRLIYVCPTTMNNGVFGLVQVKDSKDAAAVKSIFQARINYMAGDGNGPGGAYYPAAMDQWENNARVVSNGNYVMMVVHENCDAIVKEFNALF